MTGGRRTDWNRSPLPPSRCSSTTKMPRSSSRWVERKAGSQNTVCDCERRAPAARRPGRGRCAGLLAVGVERVVDDDLPPVLRRHQRAVRQLARVADVAEHEVDQHPPPPPDQGLGLHAVEGVLLLDAQRLPDQLAQGPPPVALVVEAAGPLRARDSWSTSVSSTLITGSSPSPTRISLTWAAMAFILPTTTATSSPGSQAVMVPWLRAASRLGGQPAQGRHVGRQSGEQQRLHQPVVGVEAGRVRGRRSASLHRLAGGCRAARAAAAAW